MKRIIYTLLGMMLSVGAWADTLQEQINAASDPTTIQLTENVDLSATTLIIPEGKNITLDLNGYSITSSASRAVAVKNNGTLTVKDTSAEKTGMIKSTYYAGIGAGDNSTTTFESGNIESVEGAIVTGTVVGATITINGGTFSASDNAVIMGNGSARDGEANTITINGGTFNGQIKSAGYVACGIYAPWKDVIIVNGGTFNITNGAGIVARAGTVTVNGGTFNCTGTATGKVGDSRVVVPCSAIVYDSQAGYPAMTAESKVVVPSTSTAKFTADPSVAAVSVVKNDGADSHIEISGGTYSSPLTEEVCADGYIPSTTPNADGTYGAKAGTYVAQIGDKKYTSLADAIAAATDDQTVTLLGDITVSTVDAFTIEKKTTLDLAGHTITSTVEQPIHVVASGDLTITGNGTIAGPEGEAGKALDGHAMITVEGGKLTYLNGTLTCGGVGSDGMYGVYILNGGTAIFGEEAGKTGPTITSWFAAIGENNTTAPANITVYGGSYTAQATPTDSDWWSYFCAPIYAAGSGKIDIYDGTFIGYYGLSSRYSNVDQDLNIHGGTFNGNKQALFFDNQSGVDSSASRDVAVSGGTFSSEVPEEYCADGFVPKDNGDGTYGVKESTYVAQIGETKYTSLADAIAAATADQTVTLLGDITVSTVDAFTIDKKITLDLAGHTITSTVKQPIHVVASGDLTITGNGTIAGPEGEAGKTLDGHAMITVEGGKLTYLNGTLTCGGVGSDGMYGVYILNGGTAVFGNESDKTGPTITSWFAAIGENNTTAPANITVYGGSYTAKATPTDSDWWSYFCAPIYAAGSGKIDIYDGTFNGYYGLSSRYSNVDQDLNIHGGTFKGTKQALFFDNQTGVTSEKTRDVAVSGGTFSSEVPEEYCADGYSPVTTPNSDGMYTVETTKVAKVGDNRYTTLQEAVNAAKGIENAVVTLLLDMTLESRVDIEGSMTIDLDGKTITTTATCGNGSAFNVKSGNVTIQNGVIDAAFGEANSGETDAITARSGSEITLKELQVTVNTKNGACAYAFSGGHITIESGIYKNISTETYQYNPLFHAMVVNQANEENLLVEIKGGTFYGQDPADGDDSGKVITFLPETLATVSNVDASGVVFYSVVDAEASIGVKGYATLDKAIDIAKDATEATTVKLLADAETEKDTLPANVTIDARSMVLTMPSFTVIDGNAITFPKITGTDTYVVKEASYIRTNIASTQWGTVCLPFTLKSGDIKYYTAESIAETALNVTEAESVEANTPVIFNKGTTSADLVIRESNATVSLANTPAAGGLLVGTYSDISVEAGNAYFINGDLFHKVQGSLKVPAYRAYINYTAAGAKPSVLTLNIIGSGNDADGIESVVLDAINTTNGICDITGRKMATPQRGINIIRLNNGKTVKVVVK